MSPDPNTISFLHANTGLTGNIDVTGSLNFIQTSVDTTVANVITGSGSISKSGAGAVTLSLANSYAGGTSLNSGTLALGNSGALGSGALAMAGGTTLQSAAAVTIGNAISLTGNDTIDANGHATTVTGKISGSGTLFLTNRSATAANVALSNSRNAISTLGGAYLGTGALRLVDSTNLNLTGGVFASTLDLSDSGGAMSQTAAGVITSSTLQSSGGVTGGVNLTSATNAIAAIGNFAVTSGDFTLTNGTQTLTVSGTLSASNVTLSTSNSLSITGGITAAGAVTLNASGTTTVGVSLTSLGSLSTDAAGSTALNGGAVTTAGAQTYNDPVTLGANTTLTSTGSGNLSFAGSVNGAFGLTADTNGTTTFGGVVGGATELTSVTTDGAGSTALNGGAVTTTGAQTYNDAVTLGANTTLTSTGSGNLSFANTVNNAGFNLDLRTAGAGAFHGVISGSGQFTQDGIGTTTLYAIDTYSGATTINSGTLLVDGSIANSTITVNTGGTLGGHGTTGAVNVESGGTFSPGDSPGQITVASLDLTSGAIFAEQIGGTNAGSGYDQTIVQSTGTVALNGATLDLSLYNGFAPTLGDVYTIIDNEGTGAVTGAFAGLAQGAVTEIGALDFQISYTGGNGNDVTLTAIDDTAVSISGLDGSNNAVEGTTVTATITDGGVPVTGASYQWQRDGSDIAGATSASYTPTENDEGHALTVNVGFTEGAGSSDTSSGSAGTVQEIAGGDTVVSIGGLTGGNAVEGSAVTVTSISDGGSPVTAASYQWQRDGSDISGATSASYTPTENDEGHALSVNVGFTDTANNTETGSGSAGTVQEIAGADTVVSISGLTGSDAVEGTSVTVTSITDGGLAVTGATYQWQRDGSNITNATSASYTPTENDEGHALTVNVGFTEGAGSSDTSSGSAGTVQEIAGGDTVVSIGALTGGNAVEGSAVTVTSISDGGSPVTAASYQWQRDGSDISGATSASYTPTENDEGHALSVNVGFTDTANNTESGTASGGTVQESPTENASVSIAGLDGSNDAIQGTQLTASMNEADAPASGINYAWMVGGRTVHSGVDNAGSTYTPAQADEGQQIDVVASFTDTHGFAETGSASAGIVQLRSDPSAFGSITHDPNSAGGQIYAMYDGLLYRTPDQLGFESWTAALQANIDGQGGVSAHEIVHDFLASPEFTQKFGSYTQLSNPDFVEDLYEIGLHRAGDPQGEAGWENALANGMSRDDVAYDFVFSAEHEQDLSGAFSAGVFVPNATDDTIARLYYTTLDRAPDAAGLQAWENGAANGLSLNTIAQDFVGSSEHQALYGPQTNQQFVDALYQAALGRAPDASGEQGWVNGLDQGLSRGTVALDFAQSTEAQQHLAPQIEYGFKIA